jgi:hypothetical protein
MWSHQKEPGGENWRSDIPPPPRESHSAANKLTFVSSSSLIKWHKIREVMASFEALFLACSLRQVHAAEAGTLRAHSGSSHGRRMHDWRTILIQCVTLSPADDAMNIPRMQ